ncbi:MAG TPA: hypothetical protein VFQ94_04295 [Gallionella sp.]|nr:hypothetical protein [Gallionella sp.]
MQKIKFGLLALVVAMCAMLGANVSVAADQAQAQQKTQDKVQKPELIYGSQLMTPQERTEYRAKMRSLKTKEEREAFRMEHHQQMQERAKEKGKTLPGMPPAQGGGACSGAACGGAGGCGCCGGMHGGMKHGGAGSGGGAACGAGGCCGGAGGCCGGMKHGGTGSEGGAACGAGGCCGGMHGGMQHGGAAPQGGAVSEGGAAPQESAAPQGGTAPEEHKH